MSSVAFIIIRVAPAGRTLLLYFVFQINKQTNKPQRQPRRTEGGVRRVPGVGGPASLHEDRRQPSGHLLGGDGQALSGRGAALPTPGHLDEGVACRASGQREQ